MKMLFAIVVFACVMVSCGGKTNFINEISALRPGTLLFKSNGPENLKRYSSQVILDWNKMAYEAMGGNKYEHNLAASRINAMTHLAMHDALNAIHPEYQVYAFHGKDHSADPVAACASAAYTVLRATLPIQKVMLDKQLAASLSVVRDGLPKMRGVLLGEKAALAILSLREEDNADRDPRGTAEASLQAGTYQYTVPYDFVFAPYWKVLQPFSIECAEQFRSVPHPSINSVEYAEAFNEVKNYGGVKSTMRSEVQTFYSKFWYEGSEIGWNRIARVVAADKSLDLHDTARLFALLNIALADSYIAGWDSKYYYNFWRPVTAIRNAETDGNTATEADETWQSARETPPVQDYPSTHSTLGDAAAEVLAYIFGNETSFTMTSNTASPIGSTRTFSCFSQAADENADSRVMAGLHFRFSCNAGQELGRKIGKWTVEHHLLPLE